MLVWLVFSVCTNMACGYANDSGEGEDDSEVLVGELTRDQQKAIYNFTTCLPYDKQDFAQGVANCPSYSGTVFRGVPGDPQHKMGDKVSVIKSGTPQESWSKSPVWPGQFAGPGGSVYQTQGCGSKDISRYSCNPGEEEVIRQPQQYRVTQARKNDDGQTVYTVKSE